MRIKARINGENLKKKLDIRDGKDADEAKIVSEAVKQLVDQLPPPLEPLNGIEIVEKINELPTDEDKYLIDIKHIDGLIDKLENLRKGITNIPRGGGGRSGGSVKFHPLTPDGTTKIFIVPKSIASIVHMSDFPGVLYEGAANGFTINASRTQITLTVENAPTTNSQLLYEYSSMFN